LLPIVLVIGLTMATQTAVRADELPDVVPSDALGFVAVNRLAETDAKIQKTLKQMQLPPFSFLAQFKAKSRIQGGLDEGRGGAVVAMPGPEADSDPAVLMFLPVTDFGKLIEPFQPDDASAPIVRVQGSKGEALVAKLGSYAVTTEPKHREALQKTLDAKQHLADDLSFLCPWMAEHQVVGVLTIHGVRLVCAKAREGIDAARVSMEAKVGPGNPAIEGLKVYEYLFGEASEEVVAVAVGGQIDEQGVVRITQRVRFGPGRERGQDRRSEPPRKDALAGLPAGPFVLALGGFWDEAVSEGMMQFSVNLMKAMPNLYGLSDEQADQMMELSRDSMKAMRGMSFVVGVGEPGDPLYSNMAFSIHVDDAEAYMETYQQQIEAMNEILKDADSPVMSVMKVTEIDVGGTPGLKVAMDFPALPAAEAGPKPPDLMENLFGPGGKIRVFLAPADEHTVVAAYTNRRGLRRCLNAAKRPGAALSADRGVAATAALLPPDASFVGYWSPKGTVAFVNQAISLFAPVESGGLKLPEFPETPRWAWPPRRRPTRSRPTSSSPPRCSRPSGRTWAKSERRSPSRKTRLSDLSDFKWQVSWFVVTRFLRCVGSPDRMNAVTTNPSNET
jgi:hypothetical protein